MSKLRFLVVDDEKELLQMFSHYLKKQGHDVTVAETPEEAIKFSEDGQRFDVAIIDYFFRSAMDGLQLIRHMRENLDPLPMMFLISGMDLNLKGQRDFMYFKKPFGIKPLYNIILKKVNERDQFLEKRIYERFEKNIPVRFTTGEVYTTEDVSLGGFFLKMKDPPKENSIKMVEMEINGEYMRFPVKVAWSKPKAKNESDIGCGMVFLDTASDSMQALLDDLKLAE